jgi:hypothetical protein
MTDFNIRDVFFLLTGRCGHKWVADTEWRPCSTCADYEHQPAGDAWVGTPRAP